MSAVAQNQRLANPRGDRFEHVLPRRIDDPNDDQHRQQRRDQRRQALGDRVRKRLRRTGAIAWDIACRGLHRDSCPGEYGGGHGDSPGLFQHPSRFAARGAGCKNIINQQDTRALRGVAAAGRDAKGPADVASPIRRR